MSIHDWIVALVVFRSDTITGAIGIFHAILTRFATGVEPTLGPFSSVEMLAVCIPIAFLLAIEAWQGRREFVEFIDAQPFVLRLVLIFAIAVFGVFEGEEFIYFRF